jgi:hypothetical protein
VSALEQAYRSALGWYPKKWRSRNGAAVLGTLLDQAEAEQRTAPARGELSNLRHSAILARFAFPGRMIPAAVRRRAGVATLGLGFAISTVGLLYGGFTWAQAIVDGSYQRVWLISALGQVLIAGQGVYLLWFAAGIAAMIGLRRVAIALLAAFLPASIVWPTIAWHLGLLGHPGAVTLGFLDLLAIITIAGLAVRPPRLRSGATVTSVAAIAIIVGTNWLQTASHGYWGNGANNVDFFWAPLAIWLVFLGIPLALLLTVVFSRLGNRALAGSVVLAAAPIVPLGLLAFTWRDDVPALASILAVAIVGAALLVGFLRLLGLRVTITRR